MSYKVCPACTESTHSAFEGGPWECQTCGEDLTDEPLIQGCKDKKIEIIEKHHARISNEISNSINFRTVEILKAQQEILEEILQELEVQE